MHLHPVLIHMMLRRWAISPFLDCMAESERAMATLLPTCLAGTQNLRIPQHPPFMRVHVLRCGCRNQLLKSSLSLRFGPFSANVAQLMAAAAAANIDVPVDYLNESDKQNVKATLW